MLTIGRHLQIWDIGDTVVLSKILFKGVFFDDYSENFRGVVSKVYCQLVTHTNMNVKAEGFAMNPNNVFINLLPRHKSLIRLSYTLISLNLLASLIYALNDELLNFLDFSIDKHQLTINKMRGCTHLFVDFDCTLSLWESVIPESDFKTRLRDVYKDASEVVEAPAPVEEAPAPAPVEEAPAPASVEEAPAPASLEEAPAPAPVENVAQEPVAPASLENVAPATVEQAPATVEQAPASLEENVAQEPVAAPVLSVPTGNV